jgi:ATP-dependent Lon protease
LKLLKTYHSQTIKAHGLEDKKLFQEQAIKKLISEHEAGVRNLERK